MRKLKAQGRCGRLLKDGKGGWGRGMSDLGYTVENMWILGIWVDRENVEDRGINWLEKI